MTADKSDGTNDQGFAERERLIILGTRHYTTLPPYIEDALKLAVDEYSPDVIMEEWSETQTQTSGANLFADGKSILWESIGTPDAPESKTCKCDEALDFFVRGTCKVRQHGPLDAQERRERAMCENIRTLMAARATAVLVLGIAHLHSMMSKLSEDFDVAGYAHELDEW